jgi:DnaJ like chaperone protein
LGASESDNNKKIKQIYRKLISENHPDKLIGQGMPENLIAMATERTQKIQSAYDLIKKHRDF